MSTAHLRDRKRYLRLIDLYAVGTELEMSDGSVMWLQTMNSLERHEALADAQAAQSRVALALRDEDSAERLKIQVMFTANGREGALLHLRQAHEAKAYLEALDEIESEEEWKEKVDMLRRADDLAAIPSDEEADYQRRLLVKFSEEVEKRTGQILDAEQRRLEDLSDDDLFDEYLSWWGGQRGAEVGLVEYRYVEAMFAARSCVATKNADGAWDHDDCEQHSVRIFETKDEVKALPEGMLTEIFSTLAQIEVTDREAKSQAAQTDSSESSASRSSAEGSTPSIPVETSDAPPGP